MISIRSQETPESQSIDINEFKRKLDLELLELASQLSPGVKLKSIMENVEVYESGINATHNKAISDKERDNYKKNNSKEKSKTLPNIPHNRNTNSLETARQKWELIDKMLEEKRAAYKREWVEIILQHSYQSKQKLEQIKKKSDTNIHLTEKKMTPPRVKSHTPIVQCRLPKSWMESKWYRKIANLKPLEITDKDDGITDSPQNSLHFKYMDDAPYVKIPKRKALSKYSSLKKGHNEFKEPPVLRELSIDKPLENDASNLWNRETHKKADSLVIKSKSIIQMSNAILKHKNLSHSFSTAQQGSSDQNDPLLSFAELNSIDESAEQSENQNPSTEENLEGRITQGPAGNRISQIQGLSLSILKESRKTFLTEKKHTILKNLNYCLPTNPINFKIIDEKPIESEVESFAAEPDEEIISNPPENNQIDLMESSRETIMRERTKILKSSDNLRDNADADNHLVSTDPFFSTDYVDVDDSAYPSDLIPLTFQDLMKQDIKICIPKPLKSLYWKPIPICKE